MKLGTTIKALRKESGLTADMLADLAGTTKSSVSRIENEGQAPSFDMLERLAAALGIQLYQLIARAEGVSLPVEKAAPQERQLLRDLRAMDPDARMHLLALAELLRKSRRTARGSA